MKLSHEEKTERLVAKRLVALDGRDHTWSKLRVVFQECGWKKRGDVNAKRIQAACEAAEIYPEPMLTAPGLDWEETIYFSRVKPKPYSPELYAPHPAFASEKPLQRFLKLNLGTIAKLKHLKNPELEYRLPSGGRIDILCRERKTNDLVVIELKKFAKDPVTQIRDYLVELKEEVTLKGSPVPNVKGIIITGQPSAVLERTLPERIPDFEVSWFLYRVKLELVERARTKEEVSNGR